MQLIATTTTLLARPNVHPALVQLFSQTAQQLHGDAGWFSRTREFPNASHTEFALSAEAQRVIAATNLVFVMSVLLVIDLVVSAC